MTGKGAGVRSRAGAGRIGEGKLMMDGSTTGLGVKVTSGEGLSTGLSTSWAFISTGADTGSSTTHKMQGKHLFIVWAYLTAFVSDGLFKWYL